MRHRTEDHLPGRCPRCWLRQQWCVCEQIPQIDSKVGFQIVRHVLEGRKSTNTVRVAALALSRCEVWDYDGPDTALDARLSALTEPCLLFPGAEPPSGPLNFENVVVLDGTWRQARKMIRKLPSLAKMPRVSVPPPAVVPRRLRHSDDESHMSTLEAIAQAIGIFGHPEKAQALHELHRLWVERTLIGRGMRP